MSPRCGASHVMLSHPGLNQKMRRHVTFNEALQIPDAPRDKGDITLPPTVRRSLPPSLYGGELPVQLLVPWLVIGHLSLSQSSMEHQMRNTRAFPPLYTLSRTKGVFLSTLVSGPADGFRGRATCVIGSLSVEIRIKAIRNELIAPACTAQKQPV